MKTSINSSSAAETMAFGRVLASVLPLGKTVLLTGDLGAGKTTLVRGMAQALHIQDKVQSPTFNIMKLYLKADKPLIHIDAYRLKDVNQDIGLDEYIGYESGLTVIEWPEYIEDLLPSNCVKISIYHSGGDNRSIEIDCEGDLLKKIVP